MGARLAWTYQHFHRDSSGHYAQWLVYRQYAGSVEHAGY